jgi:DNA-binding MarR family transcriptional regulator
MDTDLRIDESHRTAKADVIIIADDPADGEVARTYAEAVGARVRGILDLQAGLEWLSEDRPADASLCSLSQPYRPLTDQVMRLANSRSKRDRSPLLVATSLPLMDQLSAVLDSPEATLICAPDPSEYIAICALELIPPGARLSDISTDMDPQRLRRLADEVSRIARSLASLSGQPRQMEGYAASLVSDVQQTFRAEPMDLGGAVPMPSPEEIRRLLRLRRLRENFFDPSLFADPAWDMLLDLMAARLEEAQVAVSSLCIAAAVPPTTALRWIKAMTDHGLFERCADPDDGRRIFIRLSEGATQGMARYFEAAKKLGGLVI